VECAKIDKDSFKGCSKLRVLMLPPWTIYEEYFDIVVVPPHTTYSVDRVVNYDDFDTSLWQHWRGSMEVLVLKICCLDDIMPPEIVRATGPRKLDIYLEIGKDTDDVDSLENLAKISELVRSVTVCVTEAGETGDTGETGETADAIRRLCPHATVTIVDNTSARDYYVENVEDASTLLGSPASKWWTV